jgi:hypothetical protein
VRATDIGKIAALGLALASSGIASAQEPPAASVKARNAAIIANTPGAAGVFKVEETGEVVHLQSGLRCPASFPSVAFWRAEIFSPPSLGTDVGCDYGRNGPDGKAVSKLTIFATKAPNTTLDEAFAGYRDEVTKNTPSAVYKGPAVEVSSPAGGPPTASPFGEFRSAEFEMRLGEARYLSDLIVGVRSGWIVEVSATFRSDVSVAAGQDGVAQATDATEDLAQPALAFLKAIGSVAGVRAERTGH